MITYLLNTLVDSIKTSLINKLGLDPSTEVDLDDFPQLIDDIPILGSVEELTVTQNGTYTGTDGVTYNPVNVNLPLGTKTITANGTYNASDDSLQGYSSVTVDIDDTDLYRDTTDSTYESVKTLSNCGAFPMLSLTAEINAVQDLHGYDKPWAGGAGKNKLEFSLAGCKSMTQNSGATWSGNVLSHAGVNFSVEEDGIVKTNGTASSNAILRYAYITPSVSGDYIINGLPQDGGDDTFEIMLVNDTFTVLIEPNSVASGTTVTLTAGTRYGIQIIFRNGYNSNGLTFKPMIRLATETDATFAPYSNICPISGWTACNVVRTGKNLWDRDNIRRGVYTNGDGTTRSGSATTNFSSQFIKIMPNTTYSITMFGESYENGSLFGVYYDEYKNGLNQFTNILRLVSNESKTFTTPSNAHYVVFSGYRGAGTDIFTTANTMVCEGTPTTYEPYNGQTYTTALSTTCYGGSKDIKGNERFTHGHIASYNGETLPGAWISDRDEYAEGTTPTIGAEVVYELATPTTATSDAIDLTLAEGTNNIWASTGDVGDARYFKKVEL